MRDVIVMAVVAAAMTLPARAAPLPAVAITFDDLPYVARQGEPSDARLRSAVAAEDAIVGELRRGSVPATGFVNEDKVRALGVTGVRMLAGWNSGRLELGNHGATHFDSNLLDMETIERNIVDGEADIVPLARSAGRRVGFFRFPYNHVGDTEARRIGIQRILDHHGYRLAATTIDSEDYLFNEAYECATVRRTPADQARIRQAYVHYTAAEIDYDAALDRQVIGRDVPAVMLLHANRLNAASLHDILDLFRARNYRFVSLSEAQSDPAYATSPAYATKFGPTWNYRWAHERHLHVDGSRETEPPGWVAHVCDAAAPPGQPGG